MLYVNSIKERGLALPLDEREIFELSTLFFHFIISTFIRTLHNLHFPSYLDLTSLSLQLLKLI